MQTHIVSTWTSLLHEGVCLVCGTLAPTRALAPGKSNEEQLRNLGWHTWWSEVLKSPHQSCVSQLLLCPSCTSDPMLVATSILRNHGQEQMEAWIRSMEFELELETSTSN